MEGRRHRMVWCEELIYQYLTVYREKPGIRFLFSMLLTVLKGINIICMQNG